MTSLAASAVALVILVDLATGQGPPIYTNYLRQQELYRQPGAVAPPPPPPALSPVLGYASRGDYDTLVTKKGEKDTKESYENEYSKYDSKPGSKDYDKIKEKEYGKKEVDKEAAQEAGANPGMFSSLSNRMSGAWKSISSFGREKRSESGPPGDVRATTVKAS